MSIEMATKSPRTMVLVTHAPRGSRIGNRVTALRWAKFLRHAGFRVRLIAPEVELAKKMSPPDAVVVLHARRNRALQDACFVQHQLRWHNAKWIVALTGTDIYGGWPDADELIRAQHELSAIIALQEDMKHRLPPSLQQRTTVIYQSASGKPAYKADATSPLRVLVSGHLRREKDPFAAVRALRHYLPDRAITLRHCGGEIESGYRAQACQWQCQESRYVYLGELSRAAAYEELRHADVLVNASSQEGGPAIVTEAIVAGVAVIASDIPAHRALLGDDYGAFFRSGDDAQLAALIARANDDRDWLSARQAQLSHRAPLFSPQHEAQQLCRLLTGLMTPP